jgi:hypothetical protein
MNHLTFRSSRIIYYGPHQCENCRVLICKMGREFGGNAFTYPDGPIYPNTEWHPHVCDPKVVATCVGVVGSGTALYADGTTVTGPAPFPDHAPSGAPRVHQKPAESTTWPPPCTK